jgi:hypothetical protein
MKTYFTRLLGIVLLYPFIVGFDGETLPKLIIDFVFGSGSYNNAYTDIPGCIGSTYSHQESLNVTDYGGTIRFNSGTFSLIGKAGIYRLDHTFEDRISDVDNWGIPNDTVKRTSASFHAEGDWYGIGGGFNGEDAAFDIGLCYYPSGSWLDTLDRETTIRPFARLRIGAENKLNFSASYLYNSTYFTQTFFDMGMGIPANNSRFWIGFGLGPIQSFNLIFRAEIFSSSLPIGLLGSINICPGSQTSGTSGTLGIRYTLK